MKAVLDPSDLLCNYGARWMGTPPKPVSGLAESDFLVTLVAMAGHDLRQPLQLITSAHDVLADMIADMEQREELRRAAEATAQLARMLGQLVETVQLHERGLENCGVAVPLRPLIEDVVAEFSAPARAKGITLQIRAARGTAISHPVLLSGMLRNLIRNAIDYTPSGGSVWVDSRRQGAELRISVRDTGVGLRAAVLPIIFDAFRRGDEVQPNGIGLGLFIVRRAAELLQHRIEVCSVKGSGSCFTVIAQAAARSRGDRRAAEIRHSEFRCDAAATLVRGCAVNASMPRTVSTCCASAANDRGSESEFGLRRIAG